ncbi:MarR family transcriptional regulator [Actinoplanes sp. GCM10030250]|uniref:MarR family transcriptional regulator n=1 Tax=Actinoplanes sp. GCM10030250 TaxID=3273376 RepID=UPI003623F6E5
MSATATPAAESVARTLAAHPDGITARDLATAAGVGASTAAKALVAMEAAGTATRTPGPANGNRKPADLWHPATTTEEPAMTDLTVTDEIPAASDDTATDDAPAAEGEARPNRIVESHMANPGQTVRFEVAGTEVTNLGNREAGIFLTEGGNIVADVPVTVTADGDTGDGTTAAEEAPAASDGTATDEAPAGLPEASVSAAPVSGAPSGGADYFKIVMVAGILGDYPNGVAAALITELSGLRVPVVARVLMAMEVAGAAVLKPGGPNKEDNPDRWVLGDADLRTVDLANATPYRECVCSCGHKHRVKNGVAVTARRTARTGAATGEINTDGSEKLAKNGLRSLVEAFMRDLGTGHEVTPGTVGRELGGRSSGACGNALQKLTIAGVVVMTNEAPVRYALADDAPAPAAEVAALMKPPVISENEADTADDATAADPTDDEAAADTADNTAADDASTPTADDASASDISADAPAGDATDVADEARAA